MHYFQCNAGNERGSALIFALGALMVMSILGAMVLSSATTEISISNNFRTAQDAFTAADRAIEYAMTDEAIYSAVTPAAPLFNLNSTMLSNIEAGTGHSGLTVGAVNTVQFINTGALPPDSGSDPTYFQSRYYNVAVSGAGPNNSTTRIEAQVARVVPK